jgi:MFS superfamily sulfate permease-like transporter
VASATLAVSLLFLTGLLANLPKAVLAAIVFVAVMGLIDLRELARLRRVSVLEFRVAMIALVGVLLLGVLKGVLIAVVASILLLLHRAAFPHVALLGRIRARTGSRTSSAIPTTSSCPASLRSASKHRCSTSTSSTFGARQWPT